MCLLQQNSLTGHEMQPPSPCEGTVKGFVTITPKATDLLILPTLVKDNKKGMWSEKIYKNKYFH